MNAKKATGLLQGAGLQLPSGLFLTDGYIHSIRDSDSSVKQFENATKRLTIGSVDPENVARYQAKLREWEDKLSISGKMVDNAQKTGRLKIDIQLFARKSSDFSTVYLPKKEYANVMSEIRTWATESQLIYEKGLQFTSKYKRSGNIAGAYIDDDFDNMYYAHSAVSTKADSSGYKGTGKLVLLKEARRFKYIAVRREDGTIREGTHNDTEAKLFEFFADLYETTPFKKICMLSERGMCDSCKGVMQQFKELYPDVEVNVISNKRVEGNVWKERMRKG